MLLPGAWSQPAWHRHTAAPPLFTSQFVFTPHGEGEHWPDTCTHQLAQLALVIAIVIVSSSYIDLVIYSSS